LEEILKKYSILPLNKLLSDKEEQGVSLTFDDGYEDNLSIAEPILSELAIPSTLFVLGEPESARRIELNNDIRMLTKNQIISLSRSGWEIGSHSYSHGRLLELDSKELQKEISNSKETIESWLGKDIRYFSYPKGESNNSIREMVKRSGYERAFTVAGNSVNVQEDPLQTPRISIEGDLGFRQFCALLTVPGMYYHRNAIKFLALKDGLVSWLPSFK
jgi:peptidoglycan/xylan/chitin deacetylase (PgdA/CDA1 family)